MNRDISLILWAIPYAARWSLAQIGIHLAIPASGVAVNKHEEALQQSIGVVAFTTAVSALASPAIGLPAGAVLAVLKVYNLIRIDLTK